MPREKLPECMRAKLDKLYQLSRSDKGHLNPRFRDHIIHLEDHPAEIQLKLWGLNDSGEGRSTTPLRIWTHLRDGRLEAQLRVWGPREGSSETQLKLWNSGDTHEDVATALLAAAWSNANNLREDQVEAQHRVQSPLSHADEDHLSGTAEAAHTISAGGILEPSPIEPYLFRMVALVLPRRLWEEELGDALEVLHALRKSGAPGWQIHLKTFTTFAWSLVNALREVMSAVTGQAREREK